MKLSSLCTTYLKLIERTCRINFHGDKLPKNFIAGFWHQDSMLMCLVLKMMASSVRPVTVVMTADSRGDTIERIVQAFSGLAFRLNYTGKAAMSAMKSLIRHAGQEDVNVATPLDGPLGPLHVPKKFNFLLAHKTGSSFLGVRVDYSRKLSLRSRWDNYVIPLPFSHIDVHFYDFGPVGETEMHNFEDYRHKVQSCLLSEENLKRLENLEPESEREAA